MNPNPICTVSYRIPIFKAPFLKQFWLWQIDKDNFDASNKHKPTSIRLFSWWTNTHSITEYNITMWYDCLVHVGACKYKFLKRNHFGSHDKHNSIHFLVSDIKMQIPAYNAKTFILLKHWICDIFFNRHVEYNLIQVEISISETLGNGVPNCNMLYIPNQLIRVPAMFFKPRFRSKMAKIWKRPRGFGSVRVVSLLGNVELH